MSLRPANPGLEVVPLTDAVTLAELPTEQTIRRNLAKTSETSGPAWLIRDCTPPARFAQPSPSKNPAAQANSWLSNHEI